MTGMRSWNDKLYLGPMPGTEAPLEGWLSELERNGVSTVVCLNPQEELRLLSPSYCRRRTDQATRKQYRLIDVPIEDGGTPEGPVVDQFWHAVSEVTDMITDGGKVFIHCTAGRGRTGMFGVAVLLKLGYSLIDAGTEMYEAGSYPETEVQEEFLEAAYEAMK